MSDSTDTSHDVIPEGGPRKGAKKPEGDVLIEGHTGQLENIGRFLVSVPVTAAFVYAAFYVPARLEGQVSPALSQYAQYVLLAGAVLGVLWTAYWFLRAKLARYWFTRERLKQRDGVFSFRRRNLELYRVEDIDVAEPFLYRIFGRGTVSIISSDRTDGLIQLRAIENPVEIGDKIRDLCEQARDDKGVRKVD